MSRWLAPLQLTVELTIRSDAVLQVEIHFQLSSRSEASIWREDSRAVGGMARIIY